MHWETAWMVNAVAFLEATVKSRTRFCGLSPTLKVKLNHCGTFYTWLDIYVLFPSAAQDPRANALQNKL